MSGAVGPPAPERAGWHPDPWGDGQRYWDGEIWTRRTRVPPHSTELLGGMVAADAPPAVSDAGPGPDEPGSSGAGPRDWVELVDDEGDGRPMRSGLMRGMLWAFSVVALIALVTTAVAIWPALLR